MGVTKNYETTRCDYEILQKMFSNGGNRCNHSELQISGKSDVKIFYAKEKFFVENITPDDIRAYLVYMREYGYAPDTIRDRYNGLSTFFRFLCDDGVLVQNPVKPVKKPKLPKIPARTFTTSELQKILGYYKEDTFTGLRNRCLLYILYGCGIRNQSCWD